jgi:hypothetical protein
MVAFLGGATLEATAFTLREATPNSKSFVMSKGIFETFLANFTGETDSFCLAGRTAFFREEGFWIGLGTECAFLPRKFNNLATCKLDAGTGDESLLISTSICHVWFSYDVGHF